MSPIGRDDLIWHGQPLELTGTEFNLLEVLARRAGELVSKEDISLQAFGQAQTRFDRRSTCTSAASGRNWRAAGRPVVDPENVFRFKRGLFWKLTLALWVSMLLSMIVAGLYLRYTLGPAPQPPPA